MTQFWESFDFCCSLIRFGEFVSATWNNCTIKQTVLPFFTEEHHIQQHLYIPCLLLDCGFLIEPGAKLWGMWTLLQICWLQGWWGESLYHSHVSLFPQHWPHMRSYMSSTASLQSSGVPSHPLVLHLCKGLIPGLLPFSKKKKLTQTSIISQSVTAFFSLLCFSSTKYSWRMRPGRHFACN